MPLHIINTPAPGFVQNTLLNGTSTQEPVLTGTTLLESRPLETGSLMFFLVGPNGLMKTVLIGCEQQSVVAPFDALDGLRETVSAIRSERLLSAPSPAMDALLNQVVASRAPVDIENWARQLAEDVSNLTD